MKFFAVLAFIAWFAFAQGAPAELDEPTQPADPLNTGNLEKSDYLESFIDTVDRLADEYYCENIWQRFRQRFVELSNEFEKCLDSHKDANEFIRGTATQL